MAKRSVVIFDEIRTGLSQQTQRWMAEKLEMMSGQSKGITMIVITSNPECNASCRKKVRSRCHCDSRHQENTCELGRVARKSCWRPLGCRLGSKFVRLMDMIQKVHIIARNSTRCSVSTSWMCTTQTYVFHSSTESEVISLDAGLCIEFVLLIFGTWC